jgi:hypothetical protein
VTAATQVILTVADKGRVTAVAIGGKDKDTFDAFCTLHQQDLETQNPAARPRWVESVDEGGAGQAMKKLAALAVRHSQRNLSSRKSNPHVERSS